MLELMSEINHAKTVLDQFQNVGAIGEIKAGNFLALVSFVCVTLQFKAV